MSVILNPDVPALQDYVQPAVASLDSGMFAEGIKRKGTSLCNCFI